MSCKSKNILVCYGHAVHRGSEWNAFWDDIILLLCTETFEQQHPWRGTVKWKQLTGHSCSGTHTVCTCTHPPLSNAVRMARSMSWWPSDPIRKTVIWGTMRERETDSCINSAQAKVCESNFTLLYFCCCLIERVEAYSILKKTVTSWVLAPSFAGLKCFS